MNEPVIPVANAPVGAPVQTPPVVAVELHANNPLWQMLGGKVGYSFRTQGVDGSKATSISLATPKVIAKELGLTVKSENVKLTRKARAIAMKSYIASDIGKDSVNPNVLGVSVRISKTKEGLKKTYTTIEPANTSADDEFFASELGLTVADVRAMRQKVASSKAVIDVDGKVIAAPSQNTTEMPK